MTTYTASSGSGLSGGVLGPGDYEYVLAGGFSSGVVVVSGGNLVVSSGGSSVSATVNSGGSATVKLGGVGSNTVLNTGGYETVAGQEAGSIIRNGGTQAVGGAGVALNTVVSSGAIQYINSGSNAGGGSAKSTTLNGGVENVYQGGTTTDVVINSGGLLQLGPGTYLGGKATNIVVNSGGRALLGDQGDLSGAIVLSGGLLDNIDGHVRGVVLSGGTERVGGDIDALDSGTVVLAGGVQSVRGYGGTTSGTIVNSGGLQFIDFDEDKAVDTVVNNGGLQTVEGGKAYGAVVNGGGSQTVGLGGITIGTKLYSGASESVLSDGVASGTIVYAGGVQIISAGGIASGTVVYGGGVENILSGGLAVGTIVYGGTQSIGSGNTTSGTNLINGGLQNVLAGGTASGTIVYSGGVQSIAAGGFADGTTIQFGVSEVVGAGAIVSGAVIEAGGRLVVSPGSIVSNTHLKLGGTIDLPNLAYASTETVAITPQSVASYLLTVHDGGQTQTLQLGNNPPGTLRLSDDGSGGTAITAVGSLTGNITVDGGVLSHAPNMAATSASMVAAMTQALADWGKYILSDRPLQIKINIGQTTYPTELADDVVTFVPLPGKFSADLGTQTKGITVSQAVVGIASGQAFPSPDITITINQADLNSIYFPPDPSGSYQVPAGKIDLVSLFEHEIGHAIGFDGLRSQSGVLQNAESVFDTWMNVTGGSASLVSPAEQNQYRGQPVPLTTGASNGANNYTLASGSEYWLSDDLMGPSLKPGQRYQISGLDLAAVKTAGVPAGLGYYAPVGVNQILAPVQFDSQPAAFTVTQQSNPTLNDIVTWKLPGITNPTASTIYQIQREIWLTTSAYSPNSQGFLFYSKIEPYVDTAATSLSGSGPSLLPASGTYHVTYVLSEQSGAGRYVQEQTIDGGTINFISPSSAALTNYTPSQPDEGADSGGQGGNDSSSGGGLGGGGSDSSAGSSDPTLPAALSIYRFYDTGTGTHLFTQSQSEAQGILQTRPDLVEEVDNFGAAAQLSPAAVPVYRFFETGNGTHFFTASDTEAFGLTNPGTATYRPDFIYEPGSTLYVDTIQETSDVAVYRLFDSAHGTQFLTGSQAEYQGLTTPGSSTYRPDLSSEGIAFYAPSGFSFTS